MGSLLDLLFRMLARDRRDKAKHPPNNPAIRASGHGALPS